METTPITLNPVSLYYLTHNTGVEVEHTMPQLNVGDTLVEVAKKLTNAKITTLGTGMISAYFWRRQELGFNAEDFSHAECFLKSLRDLVFTKKRSLIAIKLETGGLHHWVNFLNKRGCDVYPILQLTLKEENSNAKTWYINPGKQESVIQNNVKRILTQRGDVLNHAIKEGITLSEVNNEIITYFTENNIATNDVNSQHITQLVCMGDEFHRAFVNAQLPALKDRISPKYIDLVAYNNVADATGHHYDAVYPQYTTSPIEYVEHLIQFIKQ